ncbi:glycosyltransferase family 22 protein [Amanita thiersii Skay4041]|uniref:Mannosyltransferase n=1 Tax=Amanita thiersii Skay4041 TaxID=703135 RepID=A0A2A9P0V1_9AGAR|nr:glycosyltransferase family 22 protein [Amanita thiersii Skay4041]
MLATRAQVALLLRISIAIFTRTYFQPDEYYQSLEPAYHAVFGYGHLTWEWLSSQPIRSVIYPALNIPVYWLLKISSAADKRLVGDWLVIACPKILHGAFAAITDIWLCRLTRRVLGERCVSIVLFLSLTSFFHSLALSRSLSNSLETSLSTVAFSYYPWDASTRASPNVYFKRSDIQMTLTFSALACMVRPTNAVIWIFLFSKLLWALRSSKRLFTFVIQDMISIGTLAIAIITILDSLYYQKLTITPLNFFLTNMSSVSLFYGSSPWHFYVTQALPILCTTAFPFTLHGIWTSMHSQRAIALHSITETIFWTVGIYSLAGHKEWRFLHPLLPLFHLLAARSLGDLSTPSTSKPRKEKRKQKVETWLNIPIKKHYLVFLSLTTPLSLYVILFYCSGPISAMSYFRSLSRDEITNVTVGSLMPCHSIPGQAYLHRKELANSRMWALGCEPPLYGQNLTEYRDQTDVFYDSPLDYLQNYFPPSVDPSFPTSPYPVTAPGSVAERSGDGRYPWRHEWPTYLMCFGTLLKEPGIELLFKSMNYREVWRGGRSWEGDDKRKGSVRIWKWEGDSRHI